MNISYVNFFLPAKSVLHDYFWVSLKSYVEDNFQGDTKFNWSYPINDSDFDSIDDIVDHIIKQDPEILLISLYVWNYAVSYEVAKRVKKKIPHVTIVTGGPHQEYSRPDFFLVKPFIDFCCETDGYGEVFFNEFLYQYTHDKDWSKVPYLVSMNGKSPAKSNKRDFVWPRNIFERNHDYIIDRVNQANTKNRDYLLMYEASRGCPYGCTYCEWGGGTSSKLTFKPVEYVFEDLQYLVNITKPVVIGLTDANFGIVDRDVDIAKYIADLSKETGYPKVAYMYGPTKKNKKNLYEIEYIFAEAGLTEEVKISVQDLNDQVIKNIKRTDTPWSEQYVEYKKLTDEFGIRIRLELMMGLPGTTIKDYYEALNAMCPERSFGPRYVWYLLPTTPAAKPEYREKFGIETMKLKNVSRPVFSDIQSILLDDEYTEPTDIVVKTDSYSRSEWCEMFIMDRIITSMEVDGYTTWIAKYASVYMGISHSHFYNRMWNTFINNDDYLPEHTQSIYKKVIEELNDRSNNMYAEDIEHYKLPDDFKFDFYLSIIQLNKFAIHIDRNTYYKALLRWAVNEFGDDEGLKDIITWTANSVMFIDHDPDQPNEYTTEYDWFTWISGGELVKNKTVNVPRDRVLRTTLQKFEHIEWHKYNMKERVSKYFLLMCSSTEQYSLFREIEVSYVN